MANLLKDGSLILQYIYRTYLQLQALANTSVLVALTHLFPIVKKINCSAIISRNVRRIWSQQAPNKKGVIKSHLSTPLYFLYFFNFWLFQSTLSGHFGECARLCHWLCIDEDPSPPATEGYMCLVFLNLVWRSRNKIRRQGCGSVNQPLRFKWNRPDSEFRTFLTRLFSHN